ncbi:MAG: MFS transporter [Holosporaceae bacterium]|jgi:MHS family proline/betaine transporter-like MFS transporter|nr:MFS transporter [Holosporaceae bacterium]
MSKIKNHESLVGALGNIFEWYDFALFMPFLPILAKNFFPSNLEVSGFLTLAVGIFMRPLGALVFGPIGDKWGRRKAISLSILFMAIPTVCIGLLPTYDQIGVWASILLILLRALQGISLGGEYTAAMVHLVEQAPQNRKGFYGSWSDAGSQIGVIMGGQALIKLFDFFSEGDIYSYAWRIPFLLGIVLLPFAFLIPSNFESSKKESNWNTWSIIKQCKKEVMGTIAITAFSAVGFYTLLTFLPSYLVWNNVLSLEDATSCSVYATVIMTISILFAGFLSDYFSKKYFIIIGVIGVTISTYFIFFTEQNSFYNLMLLQLCYGFFIGVYYSCRAAFFSETFPPHVRCTAISLSFSLAQAVFGGLTPVTMNYVTKISNVISVLPITVVSVGAIIAVIILQKNKK